MSPLSLTPPIRRRALWLATAIIATALLIVAAAPAQAKINGVWGYFGNPRAVYSNGTVFFGFVDSHGNVRVGSLRLSDGKRKTKTLMRRLGKDDHNNASLWVRPDGRIMAFWSPHSGKHLPLNGVKRLYTRTSCQPHSISCFRNIHRIRTNTNNNRLGYTYPSPVYTPDTGRLWAFWRGGDYNPTYATSKNNGNSWSRAKTLLRGGRKAYAVYASDGHGGFHVAANNGNLSVDDNTTFYLHYKGGNWYHADGTKIASLAARPRMQRGDTVYSQHGSGNNWIQDVAQDDEGNPIVLFWKSGTDAGYYYATWDGSEWKRRLIVTSSRMHKAASIGGATLDHENPEIVYLSRVRDDRTSIQIWTTPDKGVTWDSREVTPLSNTPNLRPTSPLGLKDQTVVLWFAGRYIDFQHYSTTIESWILRATRFAR